MLYGEYQPPPACLQIQTSADFSLCSGVFQNSGVDLVSLYIAPSTGTSLRAATRVDLLRDGATLVSLEESRFEPLQNPRIVLYSVSTSVSRSSFNTLLGAPQLTGYVFTIQWKSNTISVLTETSLLDPVFLAGSFMTIICVVIGLVANMVDKLAEKRGDESSSFEGEAGLKANPYSVGL
jgi:hypothetical protein